MERLPSYPVQRLKRPIVLSALVALSLANALPAPTQAQEWRPVVQPRAVGEGGSVKETVWRSSREPRGKWDTIQVHRYRSAAPPRAALFYLPGTNMNGAVALNDERYNLWLYLAARGIVVYTLDYRTHQIGADIEDGFEALAEWTVESFVADARAAAEFVRSEIGEIPLHVAGFSRGVSFAYALTCQPGEAQVDGLIALDGMFKSHKSSADRTTEAGDLTAARAQVEGSGKLVSDVAAGIGWQNRDRLMRAAFSDPSGPAVGDQRAERYGNVGEQVASVLFGAWGPGRLANPMGAQRSDGGKGVTRPEVLARLLADYDRYWPRVQDLEGRLQTMVADHPGTSLDDCWGEMTVPILHFGTEALGVDWLLDGLYSAGKSGSPDVDLHVLENHGHLDVLVAEDAVEAVFEPIRRFIEQRIP